MKRLILPLSVIMIVAVLLGLKPELIGFATFDVGLSLSLVAIEGDSAQVVSPIYIDGPDLEVVAPIVYFGTGTSNVSAPKPTGWTNGFGWYVNESGTIKTVTDNPKLNWDANLDQGSALLHYQVNSPSSSVHESQEPDLYTKEITILNPNNLTNLTYNTSINTSFPDIVLLDSNSVDISSAYNFTVGEGYAYFDNISGLSPWFSIQASCTPQWSCSAWSEGDCGSRTCTDLNGCEAQSGKPSESQSCEEDDPPPSGGGGGGLGALEELDVELEEVVPDTGHIEYEPERFSSEIQPGDSRTFRIEFINHANQTEEIHFSINTHAKFIRLSTPVLEIEPKGSRTLEVYFEPSTTTMPGLYYGWIIAKAGNIGTTIPVAVQIPPTSQWSRILMENSFDDDKVSVNVKMFYTRIIDDNPLHFRLYVQKPDSMQQVQIFSREIPKKEYFEYRSSFRPPESVGSDFEICSELSDEKSTLIECNDISREALLESPISMDGGFVKVLFKILFIIVLIVGGLFVGSILVGRSEKRGPANKASSKEFDYFLNTIMSFEDSTAQDLIFKNRKKFIAVTRKVLNDESIVKKVANFKPSTTDPRAAKEELVAYLKQ